MCGEGGGGRNVSVWGGGRGCVIMEVYVEEERISEEEEEVKL